MDNPRLSKNGPCQNCFHKLGEDSFPDEDGFESRQTVPVIKNTIYLYVLPTYRYSIIYYFDLGRSSALTKVTCCILSVPINKC